MSTVTSSSPSTTLPTEQLWGGANVGDHGEVQAGGRTIQWEQTKEGVWLRDKATGMADLVRDATFDPSTETINNQSVDQYLPANEPAGSVQPLW